MTEPRPTKEIVLPSGKPLEILTYVTARERNQQKEFGLSFMRVSTDQQSITGDVLLKMERKTLEIAVVAYDGSKDDVVNRLEDGSPADWDAAVKEVADVFSPKV